MTRVSWEHVSTEYNFNVLKAQNTYGKEKALFKFEMVLVLVVAHKPAVIRAYAINFKVKSCSTSVRHAAAFQWKNGFIIVLSLTLNSFRAMRVLLRSQYVPSLEWEKVCLKDTIVPDQFLAPSARSPIHGVDPLGANSSTPRHFAHGLCCHPRAVASFYN